LKILMIMAITMTIKKYVIQFIIKYP